MAKFLDRARMTTNTVGTGTLALTGAAVAHQTFASAGAANATVYFYCIEEGNNWEYGTGLYSSAGPTLTRNFTKSSSGSLLVLTGTAEVFITALAAGIGNLGEDNIWSGANSFFNATGSTRVSLDNSAGSSRFYAIRQGGLTRWEIGNSGGDTESGGNSGSALNTNRYDDTGSFIDTVQTVNRATGVTTLKQLALTNALAVAQGGHGATTAIGAAKNLSVPYIFKQSGAAVTLGAVTTEVVVATISFSGGELGPNGYVLVTTNWTNNNNANFKQMNVRVGGVAGTLYLNIFQSTNQALNRFVQIWNANSQSSQKAPISPTDWVGIGASGAPLLTSAVNTAAAWDLVISGQKAVAGDTLTLEAYQVLVCYGA